MVWSFAGEWDAVAIELNHILEVAIKGGASDIHLKTGLPPMFRVDGALVPLRDGERRDALPFVSSACEVAARRAERRRRRFEAFSDISQCDPVLLSFSDQSPPSKRQ